VLDETGRDRIPSGTAVDDRFENVSAFSPTIFKFCFWDCDARSSRHPTTEGWRPYFSMNRGQKVNFGYLTYSKCGTSESGMDVGTAAREFMILITNKIRR
jgi:hypothetical protein